MLVSFGGQENARTEYVTFDVVDFYYPYNAIFDKGFVNEFNAAIHMGYLCMKCQPYMESSQSMVVRRRQGI